MRDRPIAQYTEERIGVAVYLNGALQDPDSNIVTLEVGRIVNGVDQVVVPGTTLAQRDGLGLFSYLLHPMQVATKGRYKVTWKYGITGASREFVDFFTVTDPMPFWDTLNAIQREMVVNIYDKVADNFDSSEGGPYLWEVYQSQFNAFETIARLMCTDAITYINFTKPPAFSPPYVVNDPTGKQFPPQWFGLLEKATYTEFLKHISRSYIEVAQVVGIGAGRLERRDYRDRWQTEYKEEKVMLDNMLALFKRQFLLRTKRSLLVAGGIVPRMFVNPARPHWVYRTTNMGF